MTFARTDVDAALFGEDDEPTTSAGLPDERSLGDRRVVSQRHRQVGAAEVGQRFLTVAEDVAVGRAATGDAVALAAGQERRTVISLSVSVPVLSVAIWVVLPSVSTAASCSTTAPRFASRDAPSARE